MAAVLSGIQLGEKALLDIKSLQSPENSDFMRYVEVMLSFQCVLCEYNCNTAQTVLHHVSSRHLDHIGSKQNKGNKAKDVSPLEKLTELQKQREPSIYEDEQDTLFDFDFKPPMLDLHSGFDFHQPEVQTPFTESAIAQNKDTCQSAEIDGRRNETLHEITLEISIPDEITCETQGQILTPKNIIEEGKCSSSNKGASFYLTHELNCSSGQVSLDKTFLESVNKGFVQLTSKDVIVDKQADSISTNSACVVTPCDKITGEEFAGRCPDNNGADVATVITDLPSTNNDVCIDFISVDKTKCARNIRIGEDNIGDLNKSTVTESESGLRQKSDNDSFLDLMVASNGGLCSPVCRTTPSENRKTSDSDNIQENTKSSKENLEKPSSVHDYKFVVKQKFSDEDATDKKTASQGTDSKEKQSVSNNDQEKRSVSNNDQEKQSTSNHDQEKRSASIYDYDENIPEKPAKRPIEEDKAVEEEGDFVDIGVKRRKGQPKKYEVVNRRNITVQPVARKNCARKEARTDGCTELSPEPHEGKLVSKLMKKKTGSVKSLQGSSVNVTSKVEKGQCKSDLETRTQLLEIDKQLDKIAEAEGISTELKGLRLREKGGGLKQSDLVSHMKSVKAKSQLLKYQVCQDVKIVAKDDKLRNKGLLNNLLQRTEGVGESEMGDKIDVMHPSDTAGKVIKKKAEDNRPLTCVYCGDEFSTISKCFIHYDKEHNDGLQIRAEKTNKYLFSKNAKSRRAAYLKSREGKEDLDDFGVGVKLNFCEYIQSKESSPVVVNGRISNEKHVVSDEDSQCDDTADESFDDNSNDENDDALKIDVDFSSENDMAKDNLGRKYRTCPMCFLKFKSKRLEHHIAVVHYWRRVLRSKMEMGTYICHKCGKSFKYKKNLDAHDKSVHRGIKKSEPYQNRKDHICSTCGYVTKEKRRLEAHVKSVHMGIKPFKCQYCDYTSCERTALRDHTYRHFKQKPISCAYCSYGCIQKSAMKSHLKKKHKVELDAATSFDSLGGSAKDGREKRLSILKDHSKHIIINKMEPIKIYEMGSSEALDLAIKHDKGRDRLSDRGVTNVVSSANSVEKQDQYVSDVGENVHDINNSVGDIDILTMGQPENSLIINGNQYETIGNTVEYTTLNLPQQVIPASSYNNTITVNNNHALLYPVTSPVCVHNGAHNMVQSAVSVVSSDKSATIQYKPVKTLTLAPQPSLATVLKPQQHVCFVEGAPATYSINSNITQLTPYIDSSTLSFTKIALPSDNVFQENGANCITLDMQNNTVSNLSQVNNK